MQKLIIAVLISFCLVQGTIAHAQEIDYHSIIYNEVARFNSDGFETDWITNAILYASATYAIDPLLLTAVYEQESGFNLSARSPVGAIGIAQLMPETAQMIGVDPYNPLQNIMGGAIYLRTQIDNFQSAGQYNVTYALAAYNAGPQAIIDNGGVPPYEETINYIYSIADIFNRLNSYRY